MQLYVPLNTELDYGRTKPFARAVAETLEGRFGERVVARMTKSERGGKVLLARIEERGDLFAPLLSERQRLPEGFGD